MHPMDITKTRRPKRFIHIFCEISQHMYCNRGEHHQCQCPCHFDTEVLYGTHIAELGYAFYELNKSLKASFLSEEARMERYIKIIRAADGTVDFGGRTPEEVLEAFRPTLSRDYWSRGETMTDLGMGRAE